MSGGESRALWFREEDESSFETYSVMLGDQCLGSVMITEETPQGEPLWNWSPPPQTVLFNSGLPTPLPLEEVLGQLLQFSAQSVAENLAGCLTRRA